MNTLFSDLKVDKLNYLAILELERLGNALPTQQQIDQMESLLVMLSRSHEEVKIKH